MFRIKRTKKAGGMALTPPAVHYAGAVDATGYVVAWTDDQGRAGEFDDATVAKVKSCYAPRANAGQITFENLSPPVEESPAITVAATPPVVPEKPSTGKARK